MTLTKYVVGSFAVAGGLVYHAVKTREQYFPAMLYLSTSKLSVVVLGNLAFALTLCFGHLLKQIFLGQLREAEIERLYEKETELAQLTIDLANATRATREARKAARKANNSCKMLTAIIVSHKIVQVFQPVRGYA